MGRAARRQVDAWPEAVRDVGGDGGAGGLLAVRGRAGDGISEGLRRDLDAAPRRGASYGVWGVLRDTYLPRPLNATRVEERYVPLRAFLQPLRLDLRETYDWGGTDPPVGARWGGAEQSRGRARGGGGEEVLETDPERSIEGVEEFRQWEQDLQDRRSPT